MVSALHKLDDGKPQTFGEETQRVPHWRFLTEFDGTDCRRVKASCERKVVRGHSALTTQLPDDLRKVGHCWRVLRRSPRSSHLMRSVAVPADLNPLSV